MTQRPVSGAGSVSSVSGSPKGADYRRWSEGLIFEHSTSRSCSQLYLCLLGIDGSTLLTRFIPAAIAWDMRSVWRLREKLQTRSRPPVRECGCRASQNASADRVKRLFCILTGRFMRVERSTRRGARQRFRSLPNAASEQPDHAGSCASSDSRRCAPELSLISILRGLTASGTSRFRSISSKPLLSAAPVTFT